MHRIKVKYVYYKLVSLILAFVLWFAIKNNIAPTVKSSVSLPITFINADKIASIGKSYNVLGPKQCTVEYIVANNNKNIITSADFEAYVDLVDLLNTEHLNIHINSLNNVSKITKVSPRTLDVILDNEKTENVEVRYVFIGKLDPSRSIGYINLSPEKVYVTGSSKKMAELSHIEVKIPVDNSKEFFKGLADVDLISVDGKKLSIEDYNLSNSSINYSVTIFSSGSILLNQPIIGNVDSDYKLDSVVVNPTELPVQSSKGTLQSIRNIDLPVINIDGLKESKIVEVPLKNLLPVGVRCDLYDKITVTINISKINNVVEPTAKTADNIEISTAVRSE